ncbi:MULTISPECIES: DUF378 domain-containing protein [unclassified Sporosarcina]|uniref:DUF378 domain-containing protein n=1 Tax=unclassified Sporosarcina TaxID=2647733 RepID=UPI000C168579|nr:MULTISPECIES: DUF378 domain-containing protein [unclassified Sporosarcina]PIC99387.1 DUF378 domain-containing protein [Sporosarcina sp. P29]PID06296.1 DUF378 domain-containing protein [Sporosarcina sp. P30]PID09490.1 DUF378 domain-containing protein [Sporosarcina sp. P31]PID12788.1 DUF378 domain-containing protein [Sporosarcina sp. P32b]
MSVFMRIALTLVIIGALNWGLIGFFNFDLVASVFGGQDTILAKIVYAIVGLSGLAAIGLLVRSNEEIIDDVDEKVEPHKQFDRIRNVNYNTEFGEELDMTEKRKKVDRSPKGPKE